MKSLLVTLFIGLFCSVASAQESHVVAPISSSQQPLSPQGLEQRIQQAAIKYQGYGPIPRAAFFDIAYPLDADEYLALDGYAVLLVAVQSQSVEELPPKRLYLGQHQSTVELQLLTSASSRVPQNSLVSKVFGPYRWEGLYLFPVFARLNGAKMALDFAVNRSGFVLSRFEPSPAAEELAGLPVQPPTSLAPAYGPLHKIIVREFPGFASKLPALQMRPKPSSGRDELQRAP